MQIKQTAGTKSLLFLYIYCTWNVVVNVPLVVERVILATVRIDKGFHKYQSIFKWVVHRLPARIGEWKRKLEISRQTCHVSFGREVCCHGICYQFHCLKFTYIWLIRFEKSMTLHALCVEIAKSNSISLLLINNCLHRICLVKPLLSTEVNENFLENEVTISISRWK